MRACGASVVSDGTQEEASSALARQGKRGQPWNRLGLPRKGIGLGEIGKSLAHHEWIRGPRTGLHRLGVMERGRDAEGVGVQGGGWVERVVVEHGGDRMTP